MPLRAVHAGGSIVGSIVGALVGALVEEQVSGDEERSTSRVHLLPLRPIRFLVSPRAAPPGAALFRER
jgi:hypothetical protein